MFRMSILFLIKYIIHYNHTHSSDINTPLPEFKSFIMFVLQGIVEQHM